MATRPSALIAAALLAGCCATRPQERVEIKIPVPVRTPAPPELEACGRGLPIPRFEACGQASWSCLSPEQESVLRALVHGLAVCNEGWRAWAKAANPIEKVSE